MLLTEEKDQSHYVRIKDFNTFMYNQTLHHDRKKICHYCLQSFLVLHKYYKDMLMIIFKLMSNRWFKQLKKMKLLNPKEIKVYRKKKIEIHNLC